MVILFLLFCQVRPKSGRPSRGHARSQKSSQTKACSSASRWAQMWRRAVTLTCSLWSQTTRAARRRAAWRCTPWQCRTMASGEGTVVLKTCSTCKSLQEQVSQVGLHCVCVRLHGNHLICCLCFSREASPTEAELLKVWQSAHWRQLNLRGCSVVWVQLRPGNGNEKHCAGESWN